jgi:hypothetical protein
MKLWRKFGGLRYQVWYKTGNKNAKNIYIQSLKKNGYLARSVRHKDGWQIYRRKKK